MIEIYNKKIKKYKQTTQAQAQTADTDGRADKPGTGTNTVNADADGGTDPGIQQILTEERTTQAQPQTLEQAAIACDGEVNSRYRRKSQRTRHRRKHSRRRRRRKNGPKHTADTDRGADDLGTATDKKRGSNSKQPRHKHRQQTQTE